MIDVINLKEMPEGIMELGGRVKVLSGQDMTSCIFPEPLNYVEVRRIRRQENEIDTEFGCLVLCLLIIFDGEQCCIDNVTDKFVIYQRRSPSFIGCGGNSHFAQILYVLPIIIIISYH